MADSAETPAQRRPVEPRSEQRGDRSLSDADADLVARVARGDRGAFAQIYDRYGRRAYSLARRICVAEELAEDVVQEAFLGLWRSPERFDGDRGSFGTWLMTLVHHRAVDAVRREDAQRRRAEATADQSVEGGTATAPAADLEALSVVEGGQVRAALASLSKEQRSIIGLAYFGGYTQNEVAALTGLPLGTVKSRTFAALRKLRSALSSLHSMEDGFSEVQQ